MPEAVTGKRWKPLALITLLSLWTGCASDTMTPYVPAHCHGAAEPFHTYVLEHENVPGFILGVLDTALTGALQRQGLKPAAASVADIKVLSSLEVIEHNQPADVEPPSPIGPGDPFDYPAGRPSSHPGGDTVAPNELHRFVTHLTITVTDQRTGRLIWTGVIDRAHAIQGGETFHDERAVLQISTALDSMFVGLTTPCE
jgi:hypothetical protein